MKQEPSWIRKALLVLALLMTTLVRLLFRSTPPLRGGEPTLASVAASLTVPRGYSRAAGARTDIAITDGVVAVARLDDIDPGGLLAGPRTYGPYSLQIQSPVTKDQFLRAATTIMEPPGGAERWETSVRIEARLSDGTTLDIESPTVILGNDARFARFPNHL